MLLLVCVLALLVSPEDREIRQSIGKKIWENECAGSISGLTSWNEGEEFASLGIAHFIWYPEQAAKKTFQETFPDLIRFLHAKGAKVPAWLVYRNNLKNRECGKEVPQNFDAERVTIAEERQGASEHQNSEAKPTQPKPDASDCFGIIEAKGGCPWENRAAFQAALSSKKMTELRLFLLETVELQTLFLIERLEASLPRMVALLTLEEKEHVTGLFSRLMQQPRGMFALLDYLNFKGEGTSPSERYLGKGWGLLQVLLKMDKGAKDPIEEFRKAATLVLKERVASSPEGRGEKRWLDGWLKRVERY